MFLHLLQMITTTILLIFLQSHHRSSNSRLTLQSTVSHSTVFNLDYAFAQTLHTNGQQN